MSTGTLERRRQPAEPGAVEEAEERRAEAAELIANQYGACRVMFRWLGTRKGLDTNQRRQAADQFEADARYLSASKKLIDTKNPKVRAVTACRTRIKDMWESLTLPYIEPGVRLIRLEHMEAFDAQMRELAADLAAAVDDLASEFEVLKGEARRRLGSLYNPADYAEDVREQIGVDWDFPALEPPAYLQFLNPNLHANAMEQFKARLEATVAVAEAAFLEQFREAVGHLAERLTGTEDGKPKVFRDSAVDNLKEFFERFKLLNLGSNPELEEFVERAKAIVGNRDAEDLRNMGRFRAEVATGLSQLSGELTSMTVDRPRRRLAKGGL